VVSEAYPTEKLTQLNLGIEPLHPMPPHLDRLPHNAKSHQSKEALVFVTNEVAGGTAVHSQTSRPNLETQPKD
jgi:hypothetical protein